MIQIRDTLQVKFGKIDQAVELFTGAQEDRPFAEQEQHLEVLTDVSGPMYTLVNAYVFPDLASYEIERDRSFQRPGQEDWFRQFQLYVEGGQREYFTVEGDYRAWSKAGRVVVRECYQTYKWQIQQAVELLKRYGGLLEFFEVGQNPRILTDASGQMFRAVVEIETESLSVWETQRRKTYQAVEFQVWFNQMLTAVEAGEHGFYRVEYTAG